MTANAKGLGVKPLCVSHINLHIFPLLLCPAHHMMTSQQKCQYFQIFFLVENIFHTELNGEAVSLQNKPILP